MVKERNSIDSLIMIAEKRAVIVFKKTLDERQKQMLRNRFGKIREFPATPLLDREIGDVLKSETPVKNKEEQPVKNDKKK